MPSNNNFSLISLLSFTILLSLANFTLSNNNNLKIASFNTALVPGTPVNVKKIIETIPKDLDVVFLQEVWLQSHSHLIAEELKSSYPYSFHGHKEVLNEASCTDDSFHRFALPFLHCVRENNLTLSWTTLGPCAEFLSRAAYGNFKCISCVLTSIVENKNMANCYTPGHTGQEFLYDGSNGLMVLSKTPISRANYTSYPSFLLSRGLLEMCINGLYIMESHFPFNFGIDLPVMYQPEFSRMVIMKRPNILVGDLNSGPMTQPEGYETLAGYGYQSIDPNKATFCVNGLNWESGDCSDDPERNTGMDHIMVDKFSRILEWNFNNSFKLQLFGDSTPTPSDHLGITTELNYNMARKHPYCV
ncbi:predicted protein [Naegleria gruberi]|uniref:Predicted protein n=1 Tax=Naegleria gruberi TaxID=5762 RepID=D2VXW2_NAEGR|nr:uncharacterized protein NAEGRDRAFT_73898 [Naegleria gruberi]EFC38359.1 predicted protein [Naegleria gruberi]|eukprot:XP_002671103.1 predicted protein [Naegleria gruberi strain NEG-M]